MQSASPPTSSRGTPSRRGRSPKSVPHSVAQAADALPTEFSDKQPSTFISCLSIPVEGAVPIKPQEDSPSSPQTRMSHQSTSGSAKRAPRKSKTNALAALQNHASDLSNDEGGPQDTSDDFFGANSPISVSPSLDLSSVKTSSPRNQPTRSTPRPFGLQDCPVFYPTSDEFKDPMAYIDSISRRVVNYGICKVVPPVGWKMPFVTNTEVCVMPQNFLIFSSRPILHCPSSPTGLSFQDSITAPQFHRGNVPCKGQLFGAAVPLSQAARQSTCLRAHDQSQVTRSLAPPQGGTEIGGLRGCACPATTSLSTNSWCRSQRTRNGPTLVQSSDIGVFLVCPLRSGILTRE